ncbi:MAG: hypothetical protein IJZ88_03215 [Clostridia bacterium]|nr:hypothetical protein [Clostridia bacterium]
MIKIADLLIDWQNDDTDFADGFVSADNEEAIMSIRFAEKMPECHGIQYAQSEKFLKTDGGQCLCANNDWSRVTVFCKPMTYNDFSLPLAALCARFSCYSALLFHSSLVDYNGQGLLFIGCSGVGKTTQAELWNKFMKAEIVNGDKAFVRNIDGDFFACGLPWKGSSEYCLNKKVLLKAIIVLNQSEENKITKLEESSTDMLIPHVFLPHWDESCVVEALKTFDSLVSSVPVWHLTCRPDEEAVNLTFKKVFD